MHSVKGAVPASSLTGDATDLDFQKTARVSHWQLELVPCQHTVEAKLNAVRAPGSP